MFYRMHNIMNSSISNFFTSLPKNVKCCMSTAAAPPSSLQKILNLNDLRHGEGAVKKRKRWGRGIGSGRGKNCGYGHQHSTATPRGFEGGQTPLYKRLPKVGFTNISKKDMQILNLCKVQEFIDKGRLVPKSDSFITIRDFLSSGLISRAKDGVKLLAQGKSVFKTPIHLEVSQASQRAIEAVEAAGGTVTCVHFNRLALRALIKPLKFDILPLRARPPPGVMEFYLDRTRAGYLSPEIQMRNLKMFGYVTSEKPMRQEHDNYMNMRRKTMRSLREKRNAAAAAAVSQLADSIVRQFMAIIGSLQSPSVSQHAGIGMFLLSGFTLRVLAFSTGGGKGQAIDRRIKAAHPVDAVTVSESLGGRDFYTSDEQSAIRSHWLERDYEHAYLKEVLGEDALTFVREQNRLCLSQFGDPSSTPLYAKILSILDSQEKIPYLRKYNDLYYNFWQDHSNPRGVWRRISMESYLSSSPAWEVVIDFDELGRLEGESWVYKGHIVYEPDPTADNEVQEITRTMMQLSRGGADAVVMREFDLVNKRFVPDDQQPFFLPEAKSRVAWKSRDVLLVGTDFHLDGSSMTDSGYPRVMKEWRRGTALNDSDVVHEGLQSDVSVYMYMSKHGKHRYLVKGRSITFYTNTNYVLLPGEDGVGYWHQVKVPADAQMSVFADQLLVQLRSDWLFGSETFRQGSLLVVPLEKFVLDPEASEFTVLFEPTKVASLETFTSTRNYLVLEILDTVKSKYAFWRYVTEEGVEGAGRWVFCGEEASACIRGSSLSAVDCHTSDEYWFTSETFLSPTQLQLGDARLGPVGIAQVKALKALPAQFDSSDLVEQQYEAVSEDGTKVPYFLISHRDMVLDGQNPTLLYGYGGFEISLTPSYAAVVGAGWLSPSRQEQSSKHTCFVMANIRGGGEFGPNWHQQALKQNRRLAYDDFIAVAEDLIRRQVTSPARLGIRGGSNGGLLMGNMMVRRPDLFAAVCCAVPLLDMRCYHTLLAGASWMAEYGDPDKEEEWSFLKLYSAYHNIDPQLGSGSSPYPALLMTTSTRDDRVHPYHARSFVKRLLECHSSRTMSGSSSSSDPVAPKVFYYENMEGGHGGAADNKQQAFMSALYLQFLQKELSK